MSDQTPMRDEIRQRLLRRPFAPFLVKMMDGARFAIIREFQMAAGATTAVIADPTGDRSRTIKLNDVASVSDLPAEAGQAAR
jgi:hypothetical protein